MKNSILISGTTVSIYQRDSLVWSQKQFITQNQSSKSEKQSISDEKESITTQHDKHFINKR